MFNKITLFAVCCLFFTSCSFNKEKDLNIDFSSDSSKIVFTGIEEANLFQLKQMLNNKAVDANLVNIIQIDDDFPDKDKDIYGKLSVDGNRLLFTPDSAFLKHRKYLIRTVLQSSFGKPSDIFKSDLGHNIKWKEKILRR